MAFADLTLPLAVSGAVASAITYTAWKLFTRYYVQVPPNRALILTNRHASRSSARASALTGGVELRPPRILVGGGAYLPPWRREAGYLSLEPIDADVIVRVSSSSRDPSGPGWEARVALQVKIPAESTMLRAAAENLLGKSEEEIRRLVAHTVEGAVPPLLANLSPDGGRVDWEELAAEIQAACARDLVANGLVIRSLSLKGLRRLSHSDSDPSATGDSAGPSDVLPWGAGERSGRLGDLEARLDRTERNLGSLGAEVIRIARDGTLFPERRAVLPDDPMGSDTGPARHEAPLAGELDDGARRRRVSLDVQH